MRSVLSLLAGVMVLATAGGQPPQCTLPPLETLGVSAAPKKMAAVGWHVHRCAAGHEWSHPDTSRGDAAAHACPVCGRMSWVPSETGTRIVPAAKVEPVVAAATTTSVQFAVPYYSGSSCPGGVCPAPQRRGLFR